MGGLKVCGIVGWIDYKPDLTRQAGILEVMTETMTRRGPDAGGMWLSPKAALGHRRLCVVDPEGGAQPMTAVRAKEEFIIVYNGELYNTEDLRKELLARGHSFRGHSDTEVLLASFVEWGEGCLERLNGIFAFAVWNTAQQRLFLARDRLGVKPLFYTERNSSFIFGSELKAILANPLVKPVVEQEGLAEVLVMGPSRTPGHGIFKGVWELKPGCFMWVDSRGAGRERAYWQLESREHSDSFDETVEWVKELVLDAVRRQLVSDVPVATFLSGGLDSSVLSVIAANWFRDTGPLRTYSVDYSENELYFRKNAFQPNSDAPWIKLVSEKTGTVHRNVVLETQELAEALAEATGARDLPGMADVDSSLLLFCREVKKDVTVVLSGECADEIFGGYPWFAKNNDTPSGFPWIRNTEERMKLFKPKLVEVLKPQLYARERYRQAIAEVPRLPGEAADEARMREIFYLNITRFMPTLLDRKDRMSMAVGLEARVPYCDHRLVEYAWNIPWSMKNHQGREKAVLRLALAEILPREIINRKKSPYPKTHHPAYLDAVRTKVLDLLRNRDEPLNRFVDSEAVRSFAHSGSAAGTFPWFGQLMGGPQLLAYLVQFNHWLKEYRVSVEIAF
jgi:asparagine synthase (glutamine-hydrolysing)